MVGTVWHWLTQEAGLYRALVGWAVGGACGLAVGWLKVMPWMRSAAVMLHRHVLQQRLLVKQQARTINLLRTDTPGGLHDVVDALEKQHAAPRPHHQPPQHGHHQ